MNDAVPPPSLMRVLIPLLTLGLAAAAGFTMMNSFSIVQESAKADMRLSDYQLSFVQGVAAAVPMIVFSVPIGILVDRTNRVRLMILLGLVWTLGTAMTGWAQSVPMLFAGRLLASIGTTGALTAALSLCADLCAPTQRGRALLIVTLGKCLGQAGAFALPGWLLGMVLHGGIPAIFGPITAWRSVHYWLAVISLVSLIPLLLLREPARREVEAAPNAPFRVVAGELWTRRRFLIPLFVGQITVVMADTAAAIWAAPVLMRGYGLTPESFAGWMGALIFLTGVAGSIFAGFAADAGQKSGRRGGLLIGAVIAAGLGIVAALFPVMPSVPMFAAAAGLLMFCGTITALITSVALTVFIPNELRGLCIGAFIAIAGLIGYGIAPSLVTWVSGILGGESHIGQALAMVGVIVSTLSFAAFWMAMRRAPEPIR